MSVAIVQVADPVQSNSGTKRDTGEVWERHTQTLYIHGPGTFPTPMEVWLSSPKEGFAPGFYMFAGDCWKLGQKGMEFNLRNSQVKLVPLAEAMRSFQEKLALKSVAA